MDIKKSHRTLQGSVATDAKCGGIFWYPFNYKLTKESSSEFFKSVNIWQNYGHESVAPLCLAHPVDWPEGSGCVCLSAREHISGTTGLIITKFSLHIVSGRSSILLWRRCDKLRTSGLWMTSSLQIIARNRRPVKGVYSVSQGFDTTTNT